VARNKGHSSLGFNWSGWRSHDKVVTEVHLVALLVQDTHLQHHLTVGWDSPAVDVMWKKQAGRNHNILVSSWSLDHPRTIFWSTSSTTQLPGQTGVKSAKLGYQVGGGQLHWDGMTLNWLAV